MFYTRCLACKTALLRETPFRFLDRICAPCLDILRAQADELLYMEDLDDLEVAG